MNRLRLRERALIAYRSGLPLVIGGLSVILAMLACLWQALVSGQDRSITPVTGAVLALQAATVSAPACTFLAGLILIGRDQDSGLETEAHLSGIDSRRTLAFDTAITAFVGILCVMSMTVTGVLFAAGDTTRRAVAGPDASPLPRADVSVEWLMTLGGLTSGGALLAGLLSLAHGSARRSLLTVLGAISTGVILISVSSASALRPLLVWHPLGGMWALLYDGASYRLQLDVSRWSAIASIIFWVLVLFVAAGLRLGRLSMRWLPQTR